MTMALRGMEVGGVRDLSWLTALRPLLGGRKGVVWMGAAKKRGEDWIDRLNDEDMMELEFGRLLGEPPHKTLSKVINKKKNPDFTYVDFEKLARQGKISQRLPNSESTLYESKFIEQENSSVNDCWSLSLQKDSTAPCSSPPPKQSVLADNAGGEKLPALRQKPSRVSSSKGTFPHSIPSENAAITASTGRKREKLTSTIKSSIPEIMLRKPSVTKKYANSSSLTSGTIDVDNKQKLDSKEN